MIDLRSFTTFGVNAKPSTSNPIGYFGTGLKYAVAVLLRHGLKVTVWIGETPHEFFCESSEFRGKEFSLVRMRRQRGVTARWFKEDLPFTTELGRNWELWMALRELHSNTLDEGGWTYGADYNDAAGRIGTPGTTRICVEGDAYVDEFRRIGNIFLLAADRDAGAVQVLPGSAEHVYYRGLRAHALEKRSINTYNINDQLELTEDRTVKHSYMVDWYIKREVMRSSNEDLIRRVLQAPENTYEYNLSWYASDKSYSSPEFLRLVAIYGRKEIVTIFVDKPATPPPSGADWRREILSALNGAVECSDEELGRIVRRHGEHLSRVLRAHQINHPPVAVETTDDIPF